jgi:hypothetical protein
MDSRNPLEFEARRGVRAAFVGLVAMLLLGLPGSAAAAPSTTCAVWVRGTHATYDSVQAALDASSAGITLLVRGTCVGTVIVSKDATIRGSRGEDEDGSHDRAVLDGASGGSVVSVKAGATLKLVGLVVRGGFFRFPNPAGGGIFNEGTLLVKRSMVTENTAVDGGGIANFGDATIWDSTIEHNGNYRGGNIYNAGTLLVKGSTLTRGVGRFGQGLWNSNGATATLVSTRVTYNDPDFPFSGGGIQNYGDLTLIHSDVSHNVSLQGGGILNLGTARLIKSTVTENRSFVGGGILNGPAFLPGGGQQLFLNGSTVANNAASEIGGGIYNKGVLVLSGRARIGGNTAGIQGGGIFNDSTGSVVGITSRTFTPPNTPDQCVGCGP